ncbi:MAG TPA: ABC transporter ATP-binding protein [Fimbriimonas sp.]|nr:ABC transporter ATP-binding protein [Fimbriimonas sp.]
MLTVDGLGKRYGSRWLFRGLAFSLSQGDCLAVLGPNGSGKSTLLKILSGLVPASEGSFRLDGDPRTALGYSALEQALYPNLTVREHLHFAADLRGCEHRDDELLDVVGLADAADLYSALLSTGMKSRLRFALAIQPRPDVLILDEPGASLDEQGRALVDSLVKEQTTRGALLFASNDPAERRLATHELRLED